MTTMMLRAGLAALVGGVVALASTSASAVVAIDQTRTFTAPVPIAC